MKHIPTPPPRGDGPLADAFWYASESAAANETWTDFYHKSKEIAEEEARNLRIAAACVAMHYWHSEWLYKRTPDSWENAQSWRARVRKLHGVEKKETED